MRNHNWEESKTKSKKLLTNVSEMDNEPGHKRKILLLEVKNEYFSIRNENRITITFWFFSILPQHTGFYSTICVGFSEQFIPRAVCLWSRNIFTNTSLWWMVKEHQETTKFTGKNLPDSPTNSTTICKYYKSTYILHFLSTIIPFF